MHRQRANVNFVAIEFEAGLLNICLSNLYKKNVIRKKVFFEMLDTILQM